MNLNNKYIFDGNFGLERETLRVTSDGKLAQTPHPFGDNKFLDRDFCENQLELITPVCKSIGELMEAIKKLDELAKNKLTQQDEYLWINSNPPHFDTEADIPVAHFEGAESFKHDYRINLERRYGKRLMLYSGIHFNFSFSEEFISSIYSGEIDYTAFKNNLYFRLSKQVCRYSWLLVMLTAASPIYDLSLDSDNLTGDGFDGYASRRNSEKGYWNQFIPELNYSSLDSYIASIENYIQKGVLFSAGELYLPVRLKPSGNNSLRSLVENGINHIELRMFDLNPLSPLGIFREDLEFAHYFLLYLLELPDFDFTAELQKEAILNHRSAANYDLEKTKINGYPAIEAALGILDDMSIYYNNFSDILKNIKYQRIKLTENKRYCDRIISSVNEAAKR